MITNLTPFVKVNNELFEIGKEIRVIRNFNPNNARSQKNNFLHGVDPQFSYDILTYDPENISERLTRVEVPDSGDGLTRILEEYKNELILENELVANRGSEKVREISIELYGKPDDKLLSSAHTLLDEKASENPSRETPVDTIIQALHERIKRHGIPEYIIELDKKRLTTAIDSDNRTIYLNPDSLYTAKEASRLAAHEIDVHALRAENGFLQPLKIFGTGFPGCLDTEEGLASYSEHISGVQDVNTLRSYAGRVIAVDSVAKEEPFKDTYGKLIAKSFTEEDAWNLSLRAHRGGGYIKDHVYLRGYLEVEKFVKLEGGIRSLYVGKIGVKDVDLCTELKEKGILNPPKYLPDFLK
jgi:uncharacterized protein (TIGR02421 family)